MRPSGRVPATRLKAASPAARSEIAPYRMTTAARPAIAPCRFAGSKRRPPPSGKRSASGSPCATPCLIAQLELRYTDGTVKCGIQGVKWLFRALSETGRGDLAIDILKQTAYPSFGGDGEERPVRPRENPLLDMRQMVHGIRRVVRAGSSGADDVRHGATLAGRRLEDAMGRQCQPEEVVLGRGLFLSASLAGPEGDELAGGGFLIGGCHGRLHGMTGKV